jgi:hypothetical protein
MEHAMNCPKCNTQAEQRALLTSFFLYCPTCKDDIEVIRAKLPTTEEESPYSGLREAIERMNARMHDSLNKNFWSGPQVAKSVDDLDDSDVPFYRWKHKVNEFGVAVIQAFPVRRRS